MNEQEKYDGMVCVRCYTYNQAPYIEDALNGFTMQETDFPFVCVIVDDASTDGEQEIIFHYLEDNFDKEDNAIVRNEETEDYRLIFARHKTNLNCIFIVLFLKYNHYSIRKPKIQYIKELTETKYIAICEGDDYWIDPMKLKKQVYFMESHPSNSLCFCAHRNLYPSGDLTDVLRYSEDKEICPVEDMILGGGSYMATNSMMYRNSMYEPYNKWAKDCPVGDIPMMLTLAKNGFVGYLSDIMCVYRKLAVGSWNNKMSSNLKLRGKHCLAMIRVFNRYDQYTNYKYHDAILKKKKLYKKIYLKSVVKVLLSKIKYYINMF